MSKEKQIEEMAELICDEYDNGICRTDRCECNHNCYYHNKAAQRLYEEGYRKQSEWISVEERLPDNHRVCLVYSAKDYCGKDYYHNGFCVPYVTHWMPLPEAPKMRKEDERK